MSKVVIGLAGSVLNKRAARRQGSYFIYWQGSRSAWFWEYLRAVALVHTVVEFNVCYAMKELRGVNDVHIL